MSHIDLDNALPTFSNYGKYSSGNYGAHCIKFDIGRCCCWFSYDTLVAFSGPNQPLIVRQNDWGPTTGKHLNWIDGGNKESRIPAIEFEAKVRESIAQNTIIGTGLIQTRDYLDH